MNNIDLKTTAKMIVQALVWWGAFFLVTYQGEISALKALQISGGVAGAWVVGNLQKTGGVMVTLEGLKKAE